MDNASNDRRTVRGHYSGDARTTAYMVPALPVKKQIGNLLKNLSRGGMQTVISGVKTETIRKGRIFGGIQSYLEGIFGDPSLTKIQGKT